MCVLVFCKRLCQWISQWSMLSWPADSVSSVNCLLGSMEFRWRWKSCMWYVQSAQQVLSTYRFQTRDEEEKEARARDSTCSMTRLQLQRLENPQRFSW